MLVLLFDSDSFGKCGSGLINLELTCSISGSTRDFIFSNVGGTFSRTASKVGPNLSTTKSESCSAFSLQ